MLSHPSMIELLCLVRKVTKFARKEKERLYASTVQRKTWKSTSYVVEIHLIVINKK